MKNDEREPDSPRTKLSSWKRIARHLQCGERTARRWRDEEGLPVHSISTAPQSSVFAYVEELDEWLRQRAARPANAGPANNGTRFGPLRFREIVVGGAVLGLLAVVSFFALSAQSPWAARDGVSPSAIRHGRIAIRPFESVPANNIAPEIMRLFEDDLRLALAAHGIEMAAPNAGTVDAAAEFFIAGAFRLEPDGAVISFNVVDTEDGSLFWASEVTNRQGDLDNVRKEGLAHIVGVVSCTLDFRDTDPELSDEALRDLARFCEANRSQDLRANSMFFAEQVLAAAPDSATANGLMGASLGLSANWTDRLTGEQRIAARGRGQEIAKKAIAIDPDNRVAQTSLIFTHSPKENWARIEQLFLKQLSADNSEYIVSFMYARFLSKVGRTDDAIHAYRRTLAREPLDILSVYARVELASLLALEGDIDGARALLKRVLSETTNWEEAHEEQMLSELFYGDPKQAIALLTTPAPTAPHLHPERRSCFLSFASLRLGEERVEEIADQCKSVSPNIRIRIFASLGETERAFEAANELSDTTEMMGWAFGPEIAAMRDDPRFQQIAAEAGLARYWRNTENNPDFCRSIPDAATLCGQLH